MIMPSLRLSFTLALITLPVTLAAQNNNALRDCRKQAAVATNTPASDIDVRQDQGSNNGRSMLSWEARKRNGRTVTGVCEANRNGKIIRFEQNTQGGMGNQGGNFGGGGNLGGGNRGGETITARISGKGGSGKCTFEVEVDGVAEVEIRGDQGYLRTISGPAATWRRLDCNQPMPNNPNGFRFKGIDGRGSQTLVQSSGRYVVRLEDPKNGREGYTGDFLWQ
jgi:hypothetical protein